MEGLYTHQEQRLNGCHDQLFPLPKQTGKGFSRSVCPRKGMQLVFEHYQLRRNVSVVMNNDVLTLGMCYCLSGQVQWALNGERDHFVTQPGQCELVFSSQTVGRSTYASDAPVTLINIMLSLELLQSSFCFSRDDLRSLGDARPEGNGGRLFYRKSAIPGYLRQDLKKLMQAPSRRLSDKLFIQSKVMELLAFQLGQRESVGLSDEPPRDSAADDALAARVKSILESRMQTPPSLRSLARMLGTNETKLKRSFVASCGTTVYGYLTACRMQRACELLGDDGLTMSDIAAELGYSERTHFSRAFSHHFGSPPSQYRQKLQRLPQT